MTKPSATQSQKRHQESLASLFGASGDKEIILLKSSSDVGVMRNGGRNGARYAPNSLISCLRRFSQSSSTEGFTLREAEVASQEEELADFAEAQRLQSERIGEVLTRSPGARLCHLGGGHDHVYPLLLALSKGRSRVVVINVDAHADTRTDIEGHSGTPFRQFARDFSGEFHLFQVGLHPYANSRSTLSTLERGEMEILWRRDLLEEEKVDEFFKQIGQRLTPNCLVVFSVDADALDGSEVPGVSAVNPEGLTVSELFQLWERYRKLELSHQPVLGIYELNPTYDTLSMMSARKMAAFIYGTMR